MVGSTVPPLSNGLELELGQTTPLIPARPSHIHSRTRKRYRRQTIPSPRHGSHYGADESYPCRCASGVGALRLTTHHRWRCIHLSLNRKGRLHPTRMQPSTLRLLRINHTGHRGSRTGYMLWCIWRGLEREVERTKVKRQARADPTSPASSASTTSSSIVHNEARPTILWHITHFPSSSSYSFPSSSNHADAEFQRPT